MQTSVSGHFSCCQLPVLVVWSGIVIHGGSITAVDFAHGLRTTCVGKRWSDVLLAVL